MRLSPRSFLPSSSYEAEERTLIYTDDSLLPENMQPRITTAAPFGPTWLPGDADNHRRGQASCTHLRGRCTSVACTHLHVPRIRRSVQRAPAEGATTEEILAVLKLCGGVGVDACQLGVPILAEALAELGLTSESPT